MLSAQGMEREVAPNSVRESTLLWPGKAEPVHKLTAWEDGVRLRQHGEEQGSAAHKAPQTA